MLVDGAGSSSWKTPLSRRIRVDRAGVRRGLAPGAEGAAAHGPFERGLAAEQLGLAAAVAERRVERGGHAAELLQVARQRLVVGWARRAQHQARGAPAFRGREHACGRAGLDREAQPERRELLAMPRRVRAQLRRPERHPVRFERAQPGRDRCARPAPVASREPHQRRRVPAARADLDRTAVAPGRRELELPPRQPRLSELERRASGDQPRIERLHLPPDGLE